MVGASFEVQGLTAPGGTGPSGCSPKRDARKFPRCHHRPRDHEHGSDRTCSVWRHAEDQDRGPFQRHPPPTTNPELAHASSRACLHIQSEAVGPFSPPCWLDCLLVPAVALATGMRAVFGPRPLLPVLDALGANALPATLRSDITGRGRGKTTNPIPLVGPAEVRPRAGDRLRMLVPCSTILPSTKPGSSLAWGPSSSVAAP